MQQDGLRLLWLLLQDVSGSNCLGARDICTKLQTLDPMDYNCNVKTLHSVVEQLKTDLVAHDDPLSEQHEIMHLISAYQKIDHISEFKVQVANAELAWVLNCTFQGVPLLYSYKESS